MSRQAFELLDFESGYRYSLETATDVLPSDFTLVLPERNGTLALTKDIDDLSGKLVRGDVTVGDSKKLDGKSVSEFALSDLSNINFDPQIMSSLRGYTGSAGAAGPIGLQGGTGYTGSTGANGTTGYTGSVGFTGSKGADGVAGSAGSIGAQGYTGSKGDTGQGFKISATFNSLAELLAGTTTNDTFGLVAGTLSPDADDYGKLYHRFNNAWTYITDMSVKGAAGITGPQGNIGYTGSVGVQGGTGYTGSSGATGATGFTGSKGDIGYTGSTGSNGINGLQGYTGSKGDTGPMGPQGIQGPAGAGSSVNNNVVDLHGQYIDLTQGSYFRVSGMDLMILQINTYNLPNPIGQTNSFILEITDGGMSTVDWSLVGNIKWASGTAPALSTTGLDLLGFITIDGGSTWKGLVLGKDIK